MFMSYQSDRAVAEKAQNGKVYRGRVNRLG